MSNINSETIQKTGIDTKTLLQSNKTKGFITWLQSLLASQSRNLQNLSILTVFNFLAAGLFFMTQIKIANVIGKEKFGLLAYGIALGIYGQTIVRYGMNRTLVRDLIHYPDRFAELVTASLLLRGLLLSLMVLGLLIWKVFWQPVDLTWAVIIVIVAYSLKSLDLQPIYDAWNCMARHAVYNLVQRGLYFVLIWLFILTAPRRLSLVWIGFGLLATEIFYLLLQQKWAFQRVDFGTIKSALTSVVLDIAKRNFWVWLATIGVLSFVTLNQIILKHYCGSAELGGYAASWQIVTVAVLLLSQVSRIGNPATARVTRPENNGYKRKSFLLKYSFVMSAIALPIVIPSVFFPGWVMKTLFKPEYVASAGILRLLGIYIMVYSLGWVASQYIVAIRMEKTYFISVIIGGLLSIVLCLFLIPSYSGLGAAWSILLGYIFMTMFYVTAIIYRNCSSIQL